MHTYAINIPAIHMTQQDVALLEDATQSVIFSTGKRVLVSCEPHKFARFSILWNSYRHCLTSHDPITEIRLWRESVQKEMQP